MNAQVIAARYAKALFELGRQQGDSALSGYADIMGTFETWIRTVPELSRFFNAPIITPAEKIRVVNQLLDSLEGDTTMRHFCMLLADKERLGLLGDIATLFVALVDKANGLVRGKLATAIELDKKQQASIINTLEKATKQKLVLQFEVDQALLGGVVLTVGDTLFDASLKAQVEEIKRSIAHPTL